MFAPSPAQSPANQDIQPPPPLANADINDRAVTFDRKRRGAEYLRRVESRVGDGQQLPDNDDILGGKLFLTQIEIAETVGAIAAVLPIHGGIPPAVQAQAAVPPALQALLEGMQAQQVAMQAQLGLLPDILARLGAMQAQQVEMQAQLGAMQIELRWLSARASNGTASRPQDELIGLSNAANVIPELFPHTLEDISFLTREELRDLLTFYGQAVPRREEARRNAFRRFIGLRL